MLYCVVRERSLRRADYSSRGVLPNLMRHCGCSRNLKNEEVMARGGPQCHRKKERTSNVQASRDVAWSVLLSLCVSPFVGILGSRQLQTLVRRDIE
jgi:hypothetical protein